MSVDILLIGDGVSVVSDFAGAVEVVSVAGLDIVSPPEGPQGPIGVAAGQDIAFGPLTGAFAAAELINAPRLAHAATFTNLYAQTDSGVAAAKTLTVYQKRAGSVVGTASITLTPGGHEFFQSIGGAGLAFAAGDWPCLVMPNPADAQLVDLTLTLGSTP